MLVPGAGRAARTIALSPFLSVSMLEDILGLHQGGLAIVLDSMLSLLAIPEDADKPLKIFHASLFDFLCDPVRCADLEMKITATLGFQRLAIIDWKKLQAKPSGTF